MERIIYQIDSFTKERFKGNPAGVVVNADGLNDYQMQMIARELNNSETAFLFPSDHNDCDGVIRYFTPQTEVPICGHATIAAMYAKALEENLDSCVLRMKTQIGMLLFEIIKENGDYKIIMNQGKFQLGPVFNRVKTNKLISALGLAESDLNNKCPIQIASTGHAKVMIGINDKEKLNDLNPNFSELTKLSKMINCNGYFVFTLDSDIPEILAYGRMFAPAIGINEDPVTGNAFGPLGGYLIQNKIVEFSDNFFEFIGRQGEKVDRRGEIKVKVEIKNQTPACIKIEGEAVVIFKAIMEI